MQQYHFTTVWRFQAPIEQVWEAILDYQAWPRWWPAIASARQVAAGADDGTGEVAEVVFRTRLGYRLRIQTRAIRVTPPTELDVESRGELEGMGSWRLATEGDTTVVRYLWNVQTRRRWMNLLAPLLRPAFTWNHDQVMASGHAGLARLLSGRNA